MGFNKEQKTLEGKKIRLTDFVQNVSFLVFCWTLVGGPWVSYGDPAATFGDYHSR